MQTRARHILEFWFGLPDSPNYGQPRKLWFQSTVEFDRSIREEFEGDYQQAATGRLHSWEAKPESCLALIVVLDQFPRNLYRGSARAYATDAMALEIAQRAIARQYDTQLLPVQRWFIYLPLEHSEDLANQQRSVELFQALDRDANSTTAVQSALRHRDIIQRFGRFPHRNIALGRDSTPEERQFLAQPGSGF